MGEKKPEQKVLDLSASMNAVADATSIQMEERFEEIKKGFQKIRTWLVNNVSFQEIWKTMMAGIGELPKLQMPPDISLPLEEEDKEKYL